MKKKNVVELIGKGIERKTPYYKRVVNAQGITRLTFQDKTQVILDRVQPNGERVVSMHTDCKDNGYRYENGKRVEFIAVKNGETFKGKNCIALCKSLGWVENVSKPAHTVAWLNYNGYETINGTKFGGK